MKFSLILSLRLQSNLCEYCSRPLSTFISNVTKKTLTSYLALDMDRLRLGASVEICSLHVDMTGIYLHELTTDTISQEGNHTY
jgi:hypothetical protein